MEKDRSAEWFVPQWGPLRFRIFVGLLFLPYTGMVLSFVVIGSMLVQTIHWDRVAAAIVVYFLGLGIAAHALDALGSKKVKPWGEYFSKRQLWAMAIISLILAYGIAIYYMVLYVPLLWIIAILEGFFVFAYNLEWFKGRFHTDGWFAFSWGILPVFAGYILQTNSISWAILIVAMAMGLLSYVEISASRPYKELKRTGQDPLHHFHTGESDRFPALPGEVGGVGASEDQHLVLPHGPLYMMLQYERILKGISLGVICLGLGLLIWRLS